MNIQPAAFFRSALPIDMSRLPSLDDGRYHSIWIPDHMVSFWPDSIWTPEFTDLAQLLCSRWRAVDVATRAATGIEHAAQDQPIVGVEIVGGQPGADRRQCGDVERRRHFGLVASGTDDTGIGTLAKRQRKRIDEDRLAGTGLPGQRAETRRKLEFQPVDDDEIANRKVAQHQLLLGRSLQCSFWRSMAK